MAVSTVASAEPDLAQQPHDIVLQHPGALALLDVFAAAVLDDHGVDAGFGEKMAEDQPGRSGANKADLGARGNHVWT